MIRGWTIAALVLAFGLSSLGVAETRVGRLSILADVHGYDAGGRVLVPLRGIAEWLGAEVEFDPPLIRMALGRKAIALTVGGTKATVDDRTVWLDVPAKAYGGVTCVPVRFVSQAFGASVQYKSEDRPLLADVLIHHEGRKGRVLVHYEPPNVVAQVVADLEHSTQVDAAASSSPFQLGVYGTDWILEVTRIRSGYFWSSDPMLWGRDWDGTYTFMTDSWGVYGRRSGTWRFLLGGNQGPGRKAWIRAGIPVSVAHEFGETLYPY